MNFQLLEYALKYLHRNLTKNIFIFIVLTMMTWLLASMFFISNSMKHELNLTLDSLADIIIQNKKAGMSTTVDERMVTDILDISGVESAQGRVWGYYFFEKEGVYFSLMGIDEFETQSRETFATLVSQKGINGDSMIIGEGIAKAFNRSYYKDYFNFIKKDGTIKKIFIEGTFKSDTQLESNDVIVMEKNTLRDIFGFTPYEATDIAVKVSNKTEVPTVALKLTQNYPNMRIITKDDLRVSYENIFNYKNGLFLGIFVITIFTFFIIIYDRLTGINSAQKREIGILKAIGWRVEDLLKTKLYESLIVSILAYIFGIFLAFIFVYNLNAPLLRDVFIGYSQMKPEFELVFVFDFQTLFLLFFLSVPIYVMATVIPAWKIATLDAEDVIR